VNPSRLYDLAMFPLESVVLPGSIVPLHIFEPRYRTLASQLSKRAEPEFGIATINRGREVGGDDQRSDVAVVARVLEAEEYPDGRWALVAVGTRRVSVVEWLTDDPYPRASVVDWPDQPDGEPSDVMKGLITAFEGLAKAVDRLDPGRGPQQLDAIDDDPSRAIWRMIDSARLGVLDQLGLLGCPGVRERALHATHMIDERRYLLDALAERDR